MVISPHLPTGWNEAAVYDLPVGTNTVSLALKKSGRNTVYSLTSEAADWTYSLRIKGLAGNKYEMNGEVHTAASDEIALKGKVNKVEIFK